MLVVGLTGSIGTGKSTTAYYFAQFGAKVMDADKIVHRLLSPGTKYYRQILQEFGRSILKGGKTRSIDRKRLGHIVFQSQVKRRRLEKILHPAVKKEITGKIAQLKKQKRIKVVVLNVPLLFESGMAANVDVVVVVRANLELQIARITKRFSLTKADVLRRIKAQWPTNRKLRLADYVVDNRGTKTQVKNQVQRIYSQLVQKRFFKID